MQQVLHFSIGVIVVSKEEAVPILLAIPLHKEDNITSSYNRAGLMKSYVRRASL